MSQIPQHSKSSEDVSATDKPDTGATNSDASPCDDNTTLGDLRARLEAFTGARDWEQFHTPRSLAISIAIEAAELMEHYQWHETRPRSGSFDEKQFRAEVAGELADVMIYCLHFANATGTDVAQAILEKLARNETRFPAEGIRGKLSLDE